MALARRLAHEQSIGVLFTEHSMDVVFAHADRIIVLARGELIAEGPPAAVRDDARVREVYFGGGTTFAPARVGDSSRCLRCSRSRPGTARRRCSTASSLGVGAGECVALVGRNGAGKSTTMKAIMGLMARRRGRVVFRGTDISALPSYRIGRLGLGWVPEDRRIFTDLSVRENLAVARQPPRDGAPTWTEEQALRAVPEPRARCPIGPAAG